MPDIMKAKRGFAPIFFIVAIIISASSINPAAQPVAGSGVSPAHASASVPAINISGQCVDSEGFLVVAEFVALAVNVTNHLNLSQHFGGGAFLIQIPRDVAQDNETIAIRVLSTDLKTLYGNATLKLNNLSNTSEYFVSVVILNPPPNYSALWVLAFMLMFAGIFAGYIFFMRWFIGRMVLKRAGEIMLRDDQRRHREGGGELP